MLRSLATALALATSVPLALGAQGLPFEGVGVTPLLVEETPGNVTIHNGESVPTRLTVSLEDFEQGRDGSHRFLPFGSAPTTCAGRARLSTVPAILAPGASLTLRVEVDAGPGCWGVVMVEASKDSRRGNRVAVKFYHVPAGAVRAAEIVAMELAPGDKARAATLTVVSRGTAPVRPFGRMEFRDGAGTVVATANIADFGLHPGAERQLLVPIPEQLPAGRYVVIAVLDAGGADFIAAQAVLVLPATP